MGKAEDVTCLGTCTGQELAEAKIVYQHPFIDRTGPILTADYVTLEDGTGLVHTAPGHGQEDYQTGLKYDLPLLSPVNDLGKFTSEADENLRKSFVTSLPFSLKEEDLIEFKLIFKLKSISDD